MGLISTIKNTEMSCTFTTSIILLLFTVIILISSMKMLTIGPLRPGFVMKIMWAVLIRFKPNFSRKKVASLLYHRRGNCLRPYSTFQSLNTIS